MLFGELVLWDLPCAIWIKALRRPDLVIHHVAMAAVAFNAAWLAPIYYGVFYLGLIELSTIPLNIHEYFAHAARVAEANVSPAAASRAAVERFRALRDGWQAEDAPLNPNPNPTLNPNPKPNPNPNPNANPHPTPTRSGGRQRPPPASSPCAVSSSLSSPHGASSRRYSPSSSPRQQRTGCEGRSSATPSAWRASTCCRPATHASRGQACSHPPHPNPNP